MAKKTYATQKWRTERIPKYVRDNKGFLKMVIVEGISSAEELPNERREYSRYIPEQYTEHKAVIWLQNNRFRLERLFSHDELCVLESEVLNARTVGNQFKIANVLEQLYNQALRGDVTAAKEFLNRALGKSGSSLTVNLRGDDSLVQLLEQFRPEGAYQMPQLDSQGREIISIPAGEEDIQDAELVEGEDNNASEAG